MSKSKLIVAAFLVWAASGCPAFLLGGAAAGAAGLYHLGELRATRNTTLSQAWIASELALEELGIAVAGKERDGLTGMLLGRGAEEKTIRVQMRKIFDDVTEIRIRVGTFGDELQSRIIFERIEQHLQSPTPPPIQPRL